MTQLQPIIIKADRKNLRAQIHMNQPQQKRAEPLKKMVLPLVEMTHKQAKMIYPQKANNIYLWGND